VKIFLWSLCVRFWKPFPYSLKMRLAKRLLEVTVAGLPAKKSLQYLLDLDSHLYGMENQAAIAFDGKMHPKHRLMNFHDFFVRRIHAGERVLDIGCGMGALAHDIAEKAGAWVTAIDLSEKNIRKAQQHFSHPHIDYRVGDALQDLPGGRFDVVVLSNVLEHLPGRPGFLKRVRAASGALRFLIRVPLFERDWRVPLKKELGVEWRLDPTHEIEYSLESFQSEMAAAGFSIVHHEERWSEIWAEVVPDES
jgi:SAM-dependent methyltransferase